MAKSVRVPSPDKRHTEHSEIISRGKVQRIYTERGFGFIRCLEGPADDVGQDFFFHYTGLEDCEIQQLMEGSVVVFTPTYVPKGKRAEHIQLEGA